jgi:hypothetical protein
LSPSLSLADTSTNEAGVRSTRLVLFFIGETALINQARRYFNVLRRAQVSSRPAKVCSSKREALTSSDLIFMVGPSRFVICDAARTRWPDSRRHGQRGHSRQSLPAHARSQVAISTKT